MEVSDHFALVGLVKTPLQPLRSYAFACADIRVGLPFFVGLDACQ